MNIKEFIDANLISNGKLISKRCRREWFISHELISVYDYIITNTKFLNPESTFIQRLWHMYHGIYNIVMCKSDGITPVNFKNFNEGYYQYSSSKIANKDPDLKLRIRKTNKLKYGVDSYVQSEGFKSSAKKTWIKKYGVDNPSKSDVIQLKKINTSLKKYGTEYPIQSTEVYQKVIDTNLDKYGVENVMQYSGIKHTVSKNKLNIEYDRFFTNTIFSDRVIPLFGSENYSGIGYEYTFICKRCNDTFNDVLRGGKVPRCYNCYPNSNTSVAEVQIGDYLTGLGFEIHKNVRNIINGMELDIWIPSVKIGIEYNGLYYHGEFYGGKDKNYHLKKLKLCQDNGIRLITIYEDEWLFKRDIIKSKLEHILKVSTDKIYARKCKIVELTPSQSSKFLKQYHIQGNTSSSVRLGLMYNGLLSAVMTFSKRTVFGNTDWELVRYATSGSVIGGFGKLLSYFEKKWKPDKLISYMNLNWSSIDDNVYLKNGFIMGSVGSPNFYVIKDGKRYNRLLYQKHKMKDKLKKFDSSLTAWQNLQLNGYDRIWDSGSARYEKKYVF